MNMTEWMIIGGVIVIGIAFIIWIWWFSSDARIDHYFHSREHNPPDTDFDERLAECGINTKESGTLITKKDFQKEDDLE